MCELIWIQPQWDIFRWLVLKASFHSGPQMKAAALLRLQQVEKMMAANAWANDDWMSPVSITIKCLWIKLLKWLSLQ